MKSEFEKWFVKQFGKRNRISGTDFDLTIRIGQLRTQMMDFEIEMEDRRRWNTRYDSALKAWCARDYKKGKKK